MLRRVHPRLLLTFIVLTLAISVGALAFGPTASSQEDDIGDVKAAPNFSRLLIKPGALGFRKLIFPKDDASPSETASFTIFNNGRGTTVLTPTVGAPSGTGAAAFTILSGGGPLAALAPGHSAPVMIQFNPVADGVARAEISVSAPDATRGPKSRVVHLAGSAKGPIPSASATATATATPTPTPTMAGSSTATPTPSNGTATPTPTPGPVSTDKNSANAPGVEISGTTVTVNVPLGSDDDSATGMMQVVVENAASVLPTPSLIATDRVNSCTPSKSGEVVCSGQGGTVDLIPAGSSSPTILPLSASTVPTINYAAGDCQGCGALVDDTLSPALAIISSGLGYIPVNLSTGTVGNPIATNGTNSTETVGVDFGYDMVNHLILSANYQVTDVATFGTSNPYFQIINIANPASPIVYEFVDAPGYFNSNGRTCGSSDNNDKLPDVTALDTVTHIAYVTFHTPSTCFNAPPDDIAMFDLSQVVFTPGTPNTWDTPSKAIQSITGTGLNGIDPISVESTHHLALVSAGNNNFGVLVLPSASGAGNPALSGTSITDWVNALMPNDPNNVAWAGWHQPSGLSTYVSPNTNKVMGVMMNNPSATTGPTFLAIVDMDDLLTALRDPSNAHKVDSSVNLVTSGLVRFVPVQ